MAISLIRLDGRFDDVPPVGRKFAARPQEVLGKANSCVNLTVGLYICMVVIHRAHGFRFVIYTADHDPAHIHITGPGQAKINLTGTANKHELVSVVGIKRFDMRRLMAVVAEHREEFLMEWERIHGKSD